MLAGRDSWYMSPITELGRFRPDLAPTFAELVRLFRELAPPSLEKVVDTAATFNALGRYAIARLRKRPLKWLKTEHTYPNRSALLAHKRKLGEILVQWGSVPAEA